MPSSWLYAFSGAAVVLLSSCAEPESGASAAAIRSPFVAPSAARDVPAARGTCPRTEALFVADRGGAGADDKVERFDSAAGADRGAFVAPAGNGGLSGAGGLVFTRRDDPAELLVVNQNANTTSNGEVLRFDAADGHYLGKLVDAASPNAPFFPRGIVVRQGVVYVADAGDPQGTPSYPGRIARFDVNSGAFLGDLDASAFKGVYRPRGLVFGPDGLLYASLVTLGSDNGGYVVRFDPGAGAFAGVVFDGTTCGGCAVNRPDALVFGPDQRIYVTTGRRSTDDTDKIVILDVKQGVGSIADHLDLAPAGPTRSAAPALAFGPGGGLFVTISSPNPAAPEPESGAVRRYDLKTRQYVDFAYPAASGGPLAVPSYLVFRDSDPATLSFAPAPCLGP